MLQLNKHQINTERLFKKAPIVLEIRLAHFNDPDIDQQTKKDAVFVLASKYTELAYANYALENYNEVKPDLIKAAPFCFLLGFDPQLKTANNGWTIQQDLNRVILFGDDELLKQLSTATIRLSSISYHAMLLYIQLLKQFACTKSVATAELDQAINEAQNTKDKDVLQYILPLLQAIQALTQANQNQWQSSIDKAIKWHTDECKFGELADMEEGYMCLNALTMAKLGKQLHGWQCSTESLYLPLFLID